MCLAGSFFTVRTTNGTLRLQHVWRLAQTCLVLLSAWSAMAAERVFDFSKEKLDTPPPSFRSALLGAGKPGDWRVILDETAGDAPAGGKRAVLAQLSRDPTDEHFPLLILDDEVFGDFTLTTRFKTVGGAIEQMAGIAFRIQDDKNFYVVRASSLGNNLRFYRVSEGLRDNPIGPDIQVPKGVWHELAIECRGNRIRLRLNGKEAMPELTDNSFSEGKIAFWTKSDSVSYFSDLKISYTPREYLAQALVRELMRKYPRLLGIKIFCTTTRNPELRIVASNDPKDLNQPAAKVEKDCIAKNACFYGKGGKKTLVTMPLHDRNGDPIAAVRLTMESFPGQTEQNAVARALPIVNGIEPRVRSVKDFTE